MGPCWGEPADKGQNAERKDSPLGIHKFDFLIHDVRVAFPALDVFRKGEELHVMPNFPGEDGFGRPFFMPCHSRLCSLQ